MCGMKNLSKNLIWALIILLVISAVYSAVAGKLAGKKEMTLSELVAKINAGEVASIDITDSDLAIKLKDNTEYQGQKEFEAGLSETLKNYGVDQQKLNGIAIGVKTRGGFNFLMGFIQ